MPETAPPAITVPPLVALAADHPPCAITALDAGELSEAIHARRLSCREVMQAYLARIATLNPSYNAIVNLRPEPELLAEADAADAELARGASRGWMHGMPQAIKDLSNARGLPTTLGSPLMRHFMPHEDGLLAARHRAAGGIFIGKTNTPEFGLGSNSFNPVFGATRNAWAPGRTAGGSSGGAAVALALHLLPVADGSDFMGSLRNPAGWNNVYGLRPSQGRVPLWPTLDVWIGQLATEGPMARNVADLARLLGTQCGPDARVPLALADRPDFLALLDEAPVAPRIGWLADLDGYLPMEAGVLDTCAAALRRWERAGAAVEGAALGFAPERAWQAWLVWRQALVGPRIAPFLVQAANRDKIKPEALWEYDQSLQLSGAALLAASHTRTAFFQQMLALLERFDALALPVAQVWPFDLHERWPRQIAGKAMDTYHRWMEVVSYATFAGLPTISVPAGFGAEGLPMGLQLIGKPQGDAALLRLARHFEARAAA